MASGEQRAIEDVDVFDEVVTAEGRSGQVVSTFGRFHEGGLVGVRLRGLAAVEMTPEHPVLTKRGYIAASDLVPGDHAAVTRYLPSRAEGVSWTYNTSVGRLIGLYLAEGSTTPQKIVWTFGRHEENTLVAETVELVRAVLGKEARIQVRQSEPREHVYPDGSVYMTQRVSSINVVVYSKVWKEWFEEHCGTKSWGKGLSPEAASGPPEFLRAVLEGWLDGDGHRRRTSVVGVTVSKRLALDMHAIANGLGLRPALRHGKVVRKRDRYDLEMGANTDHRRGLALQDDTTVWRRVTSIEKREWAGRVFNLHVAGDESYVANGMGVHNCVGFGCSAMMSITNHRQRVLATGQDLTFRYECLWLYAQAQLVDEWPDTPPAEGTSVRAGCDVLRDVGHRRVQNGVAKPPSLANGISANRWATTVDEIRAALYSNVACAIGINWYSKMDSPYVINGERWVDVGGQIRGGHCLCIYRMSDRRQAFMLMNSWGEAYAPVWIGYQDTQRLIDEAGEAVVITDR